MSLVCELPPKAYIAFLNGVVKMSFYNDKEITVDLLKEQIFSASPLTTEEIGALVTSTQSLLTQAAANNWSQQKIEEALSEVSAEQKETFLAFWKREEGKIHDKLVEASVFSPSLQHVSWRVDIATSARQIQNLNDPTAIVEMGIRKSARETEVVRFEMDKTMLSKLVKDVATIEKVIADAAGR